jgi:putative ABC transport system substrate-binding protein
MGSYELHEQPAEPVRYVSYQPVLVAAKIEDHAVVTCDRMQFHQLKRRELFSLLGGAVAWPLTASAQEPRAMRRLGVLIGVSGPDGQARAAALVQGLAALNWHEGSNLQIDWRWAGGDITLYERYAAELVSLRPDVLHAQGSLPITLLRQHTSTIPIVFTIVADPLGQGFVASLARPGGNITGFSSFDPQMTGKWLEMLTQISPPVARAAVLFNPATALYAGLMLREIEEAARSLAVEVRAAPCSDYAEVAALMAGLAREERGGLLVLPGVFTDTYRVDIVVLAARYRIATVYPTREFVESGGMMSYGIDNIDVARRAADYIDRILRGAKPAELPVQRPTKFELMINLRTAKALGFYRATDAAGVCR